MRAAIIMAVAVLAACSGGEEAKAPEPEAASLDTGLWDVSREVTSITPTDHAPATAVKGAAGDKATAQICVGAGESAKPDPALFAGEGYKCSYRDTYIRNGRLNASLTCKPDGITGEVMMTVEGSFKAGSFDATVNAASYLPGDGDFKMATKLSGRHAGTCPPAGTGDNVAKETE